MTEKKQKKFSWIRFIVKAVIWLLLLLIFAVVCLYYYLGTIVREAINRYVPPITGTKASVEHVDLSLLKGRIEIKDLQIGNPKGYSSNDIFDLGSVLVTFNPKSVLTDKIIINSVVITGTKVSAELKNLYSLDSNISALQENINKFLGTTSKEPAKTPSKKEKASQSSSGKKVIIKDLKIQDTKLSLGAGGHTVTIPLPSIHKTGIGEEKKSKSIAEVFADILNLISVESVKGVASAASDLAKKGWDGAKDLAAGGIDSVKKGAQSISDTAKSATDSLKSLFK